MEFNVATIWQLPYSKNLTESLPDYSNLRSTAATTSPGAFRIRTPGFVGYALQPVWYLLWRLAKQLHHLTGYVPVLVIEKRCCQTWKNQI